MLTKIFQTGAADLESAAGILKRGGLCALPTETVYGLAADGLNPAAVEKIFLAKGRPQDNPLILHIDSLETLDKLCELSGETARRVDQVVRFWPGPLTLVLPRRPLVPDVVTAGMETVAVRFPANPVARELIRRAGVPLAAPSANTSGRPSPTTAGHVAADLGGKIDCIVDGGPCAVGLESTVLSLAGRPRLLRPGYITLEQLTQVLGDVEVDSAVFQKMKEGQRASAPGMKYRHYAPRAPLTLVRGSDQAVLAYLKARVAENPRTGILCYDGEQNQFSGAAFVLSYGGEGHPEELAVRLFAALRTFDKTDVERIYARMPSADGVGLAVVNRLLKAAGHTVIDV